MMQKTASNDSVFELQLLIHLLRITTIFKNDTKDTHLILRCVSFSLIFKMKILLGKFGVLFLLTQAQANTLLRAAKILIDSRDIIFPEPGQILSLDAETTTGVESFIIDVNRRGRITVGKCTYQTRYNRTDILLRVDIEGPPHTNPDGVFVPCPHIHIYREGYMDKWAYPINTKMPTNVSDLGQVLHDFLMYNNITNVPQIHSQGGGLV